MSAARQVFHDRVSSLRNAITVFSLQDKVPTAQNADHNKSVKIIRNGLAVQCFNIFEDFVRARTFEILTEISSSGVAFSYLPDDLQHASTVQVVKALEHQVKLQDKTDRIRFVQDHSEQVSSTKKPTFSLSELTFFHASSNISKDQYRDALAAFSVDKPWDQVSGLCSRLGVSAVPADSVFLAFAGRRHDAAHNPNASVSETDLQQAVTDATGLAICFDVLATKCCAKIKAITTAAAQNGKLIQNQALIPLRTVRFKSGKYFEKRDDRKRAYRSHADRATVVREAWARTANEDGVLAIYDARGLLAEWMM